MRFVVIALVLFANACNQETDMGLLDTPPTRPRTYVDGTPVDPNDMNETFDSIIALKQNSGSGEDSFFPSPAFASQMQVNKVMSFWGTNKLALESTTAAGGTKEAVIPIRTHVGLKLDKVVVSQLFTMGAAESVTYTIEKSKNDGTADAVVATIVHNVSDTGGAGPHPFVDVTFNALALNIDGTFTVQLRVVLVTAGGGGLAGGASANSQVSLSKVKTTHLPQ